MPLQYMRNLFVRGALVSLGYWGNYNYFNLRGDRRNAAIQVFECVETLPIQGLATFGDSFFDRPYRKLIAQALVDLDEARNKYRKIETENFWKNSWYFAKSSLAFMTIGVAGLSAAAIAGALTGGGLSPLGVIAAKSVIDGIEVSDPVLEDSSSLRGEIDKLQCLVEDYFDSLLDECGERLSVLRKFPDIFSISLDEIDRLNQGKASGVEAPQGTISCSELRKLCRDLKGASSCYLGNEVPDAKLKNARELFGIRKDDCIYLVYDDTLFGSCKCGFAIWHSGISWRNDWAHDNTSGRIAWNELGDKEIEMEGSNLLIGDKQIAVSLSENRKKFKEMLCAVKGRVSTQGFTPIAAHGDAES
jgi:hypothetical protein